MSDLIKLLPDSVANQIAAGEVIQRPASAVKELLENSIDAGADDITLVIKDAGKTSIQVTDNGCGMSERDARMSFERHATSKIHKADDLFAIRTMGFRGEALASIAAISLTEIKTKTTEDEIGIQIKIEGSKLIDQQPVSCPTGTTIIVKNLFFNVPARRKFLKSNTAEFRHIIEEFQRIAIPNSDKSLSLTHNGKTIFKLPKSSLKERIVNIMGSYYNERIIKVEQTTNQVHIFGYIGKPQYAKKTRGEQYFFVNKRFIKHPYLHHAVDNAFEELLPNDTYPSYFIFIEIYPDKIDINIHPTKTEVNFENYQLIYAIIKSAIRQSLGKFNIIPSMDFEVEQSLDLRERDKDQPVRNPFYQKETQYNPFESGNRQKRSKDHARYGTSSKHDWENLYEITKSSGIQDDKDKTEQLSQSHSESSKLFDISASRKFFQVQNRLIITFIKSGIMIIDQHNAHLRILYEKYLDQLKRKKTTTQKELFPQHINFSQENSEILREIKNELKIIGFSINEFGKNTFVLDGSPSNCINMNISDILEEIIENFRNNISEYNLSTTISLARALAAGLAIRHGKKLQPEEMEELNDQLFSCSIPDKTPDGRLTFEIIPFESIDKKFK